MSLQLHTIENPYISLEKNINIPFDSDGIVDISLELATKAPHQLNLTINPNLGSLYRFFLDNPTAGLRIDQDDGLSLAFIKRPEGSKDSQTPTGELKIKMLSTVSLLYNTRVYTRKIPLGFSLNGSIKEYFENLSDKVIIDFISNDQNANYLTPIGSLYDQLTQSVDNLGNYSWRDLGVKNNTVYLEVGNSQNRPVLPGLIATNLTAWPKVSRNIILVDSVTKNGSGETLTHVRPVGNKGLGGDLSTTFFITDTNINTIEQISGFPLVESKDVLANGLRIYDVENTEAVNDPNITSEISEVYVVNLAEYQDSNTPINFNQAQTVYNRSVNFLKTKNDTKRFSVELMPNKILLPGDKIEARFAYTEQSGQIFKIEETVSLGAIRYSKDDLLRISTM